MRLPGLFDCFEQTFDELCHYREDGTPDEMLVMSESLSPTSLSISILSKSSE